MVSFTYAYVLAHRCMLRQLILCKISMHIIGIAWFPKWVINVLLMRHLGCAANTAHHHGEKPQHQATDTRRSPCIPSLPHLSSGFGGKWINLGSLTLNSWPLVCLKGLVDNVPHCSFDT